ncbi:MAG: ABC-F family ATP-binding cassette domain-containing protein [Fibrobacterales bacterium]
MAEVIVNVQGLCKAWGEKVLFESMDVSILKGQKTAFLGINGCGKSTLMRIIAGLEDDFVGEVIMRNNLRVHYLHQDADLAKGNSIIDYICSSKGIDGDVVLQYHNAILSGEGIGEAEEELNRHHGRELYSEIKSLAGRLDINLDATFNGSHSGGQLKKIQLVQALTHKPDLLLLDEPTNHLDDSTIIWLESYLKNFSGTLMMVTHDRYFLNRVVNHTIELWRGSAYGYTGNYDYFLEKKSELEAQLAREDEKRQSFLKKEIDWIRRGPKARGTKAKYRIDKFNDAASKERFKTDSGMALNLDSTERLGKTILKLHNVSKSFGDHSLFSDFSLELIKGDRIGIIGPNGCGKTTLLKIILEKIESDSGKVIHGVNTKIAYFDQKRDTLDPEQTVWKHIGGDSDHVYWGDQKIHKRSFLEKMLFSSELQNTKIERLSGGEKNRLQLAEVMLTPSNVLILDEPTNDLDIYSLQVLEETLRDYPGCVIIVSHDRYFLDKICTSSILFNGGSVYSMPGSHSYCMEWLKEQQRIAAPVKNSSTATKVKKESLSYTEKKDLETIEETILEREEDLASAESKLADASATNNIDSIQEFHTLSDTLRDEVTALYERWDYLEEKKSRIA